MIRSFKIILYQELGMSVRPQRATSARLRAVEAAAAVAPVSYADRLSALQSYVPMVKTFTNVPRKAGTVDQKTAQTAVKLPEEEVTKQERQAFLTPETEQETWGLKWFNNGKDVPRRENKFNAGEGAPSSKSKFYAEIQNRALSDILKNVEEGDAKVLSVKEWRFFDLPGTGQYSYIKVNDFKFKPVPLDPAELKVYANQRAEEQRAEQEAAKYFREADRFDYETEKESEASKASQNDAMEVDSDPSANANVGDVKMLEGSCVYTIDFSNRYEQNSNGEWRKGPRRPVGEDPKRERTILKRNYASDLTEAEQKELRGAEDGYKRGVRRESIEIAKAMNYDVATLQWWWFDPLFRYWMTNTLRDFKIEKMPLTNAYQMVEKAICDKANAERLADETTEKNLYNQLIKAKTSNVVDSTDSIARSKEAFVEFGKLFDKALFGPNNEQKQPFFSRQTRFEILKVLDGWIESRELLNRNISEATRNAQNRALLKARDQNPLQMDPGPDKRRERPLKPLVRVDEDVGSRKNTITKLKEDIGIRKVALFTSINDVVIGQWNSRSQDPFPENLIEKIGYINDCLVKKLLLDTVAQANYTQKFAAYNAFKKKKKAREYWDEKADRLQSTWKDQGKKDDPTTTPPTVWWFDDDDESKEMKAWVKRLYRDAPPTTWWLEDSKARSWIFQYLEPINGEAAYIESFTGLQQVSFIQTQMMRNPPAGYTGEGWFNACEAKRRSFAVTYPDFESSLFNYNEKTRAQLRAQFQATPKPKFEQMTGAPGDKRLSDELASILKAERKEALKPPLINDIQDVFQEISKPDSWKYSPLLFYAKKEEPADGRGRYRPYPIQEGLAHLYRIHENAKQEYIESKRAETDEWKGKIEPICEKINNGDQLTPEDRALLKQNEVRVRKAQEEAPYAGFQFLQDLADLPENGIEAGWLNSWQFSLLREQKKAKLVILAALLLEKLFYLFQHPKAQNQFLEIFNRENYILGLGEDDVIANPNYNDEAWKNYKALNEKLSRIRFAFLPILRIWRWNDLQTGGRLVKNPGRLTDPPYARPGDPDPPEEEIYYAGLLKWTYKPGKLKFTEQQVVTVFKGEEITQEWYREQEAWVGELRDLVQRVRGDDPRNLNITRKDIYGWLWNDIDTLPTLQDDQLLDPIRGRPIPGWPFPNPTATPGASNLSNQPDLEAVFNQELSKRELFDEMSSEDKQLHRTVLFNFFKKEASGKAARSALNEWPLDILQGEWSFNNSNEDEVLQAQGLSEHRANLASDFLSGRNKNPENMVAAQFVLDYNAAQARIDARRRINKLYREQGQRNDDDYDLNNAEVMDFTGGQGGAQEMDGGDVGYDENPNREE